MFPWSSIRNTRTSSEPERVAAAEVPVAALASGLTRHVESFSGVVPGQANFDLTLTCPSQMLAVSGGHFVGTDINATQLVASRPVTDQRRWNLIVFNPHLGDRKFEVHVVCLK